MSTSAVIERVRRVAERQDGRVTRPQLRALGADDAQIGRWARKGWIVHEHRGVYVLGARQLGRSAQFRSALLTMGDRSTLSYLAAGAHWEVLKGAVPIEVTVPAATGRGHRSTIRVHRADLPPEHVTVHKGLRVTTLLRTHLDLAGVLAPARLARMFEQAQVLHHLAPDLLAAEVVCRRGYRGTPALRRLLEGAVDPSAVRSVLELRFLKLCEAAGVPRPLVNEPLGPWVPDFLWPAQRVVVETDGYAFHRTAAQRRRDAEKDAWLRARGYTIIRLTWADVTDRAEYTTGLVAAALAAR